MKSASDKFLGLLPTQLGLGPHAARLLAETQGATRSRLWASVIILSATLVDVIRNEDHIFDLADERNDELYDYEAAGYFESGGFDYLSAAERKKLEWLRAMRNQLVHYDGPVEGLMGRASDEGVLAQYADKALSAILPVLLQD